MTDDLPAPEGETRLLQCRRRRLHALFGERSEPLGLLCGTGLGQLDGGRWLTLEGTVALAGDPERVAAAVTAYTERYRPPRGDHQRVAVEIAVDQLLGRA